MMARELRPRSPIFAFLEANLVMPSETCTHQLEQIIFEDVLLSLPAARSGGFFEMLRLRQGLIATLRQLSRRDPKTSYASTI